MSRRGVLVLGLSLCALWLGLWLVGAPAAAGGLAGLVGSPGEQLLGIVWILVRPLAIVLVPPLLLCALVEHVLGWKLGWVGSGAPGGETTRGDGNPSADRPLRNP